MTHMNNHGCCSQMTNVQDNNTYIPWTTPAAAATTADKHSISTNNSPFMDTSQPRKKLLLLLPFKVFTKQQQL